MFKAFLRVAALAVGATALLTVGTGNARADFFDDLFGGSGGSYASKEMVRFSPKYTPNQIIISFGDRRLYYVLAPGKAISYPIAIPKGDARWAGTLSVSSKKVDPEWIPTEDMRRENPKLPAYVPGGHPRNPLGVRALYLGNTLYRVHGTDAPWLIGQEVSHGCVRMLNSDVIDLYNRTRIGTKVTVTWAHFTTS